MRHFYLSYKDNKKLAQAVREISWGQNVKQNKRSKILNAIEKTKNIDKKEFKDFEGTLDDGI